MTGIGDCIRRAGEAGLIRLAKARELANILEESEKNAQRIGGAEAVRRSTPAVLETLLAREARKQANLSRQATVQKEIGEVLRGFKGKETLTGAEAILATDYRAGFTRNLETATDFYRANAHAPIAEFLQEVRPTLLGKRPLGEIEDVIRAVRGEPASEMARDFAKAVRESLDYILNQMRVHGADVARIENYYPQNHSARLVRGVGDDAARDEWVNFIFPRLDREVMISPDNGLPMPDEELIGMLRRVWSDIVLGRAHNVDPEGFINPSTLKRLESSRRLHFKDAQAQIDYHNRFGEGDFVDILTNYIDARARDLAAVEILGPQPGSTLKFMSRLIAKRSAETGEAINDAKALDNLNTLFDHVTGNVNVPEGSWPEKLTMVLEGTRAIVVSAVIGSAQFAALSDVSFISAMARMNGLPTSRMFGRMLQMYNPANKADRALAVRAGLLAQGWASRAHAVQRILGETLQSGTSRKINDFVLRASLLSSWTEANRWAVGMELLGFLTDNAGHTFDELPDLLRTNLMRHGLNEADWNVIRTAPRLLDERSGVEFITHNRITDERVAQKLFGYVKAETDAAIPITLARTRALLIGKKAPDTVEGMLRRDFSALKSFPVSMLLIQSQRTAALQGGANRAKYAAHLLLATTLTGMIGEQMALISRGQEPGNLDDPNLWMRAAMRGGAWGIGSDLLFQTMERSSPFASPADLLLGPVLDAKFQAINLVLGNLGRAINEDQETRVGRDLIRFMKQTLPGNRLWYGRLAFERLVFDELQKAIDPGAEESFRSRVNFARRRGQEFFAPPGEKLKFLQE